MKKVFVLLFVGIMLVSFNSCTNKKPENLADLKAKYEKKELKNCEEAVIALSETQDIYFATLDKAYNGDAKAKEEFDQIQSFFEIINKKIEPFDKDCDSLKPIMTDFQNKIEQNFHKFIKIYDLEGLFNEDTDNDSIDTENTQDTIKLNV